MKWGSLIIAIVLVCAIILTANLAASDDFPFADWLSEDKSFDELTEDFDVIIMKHCFPSSNILEDVGNPDPSSERRSLENVQFVRGTVADGFHTTHHCDCGFVNEHRAPERDGHSLDHYPDLFKTILMLPEVKNIKVAWYWSEETPKETEEKITISEFLRKNEAAELSSLVKYKIIKESYF